MSPFRRLGSSRQTAAPRPVRSAIDGRPSPPHHKDPGVPGHRCSRPHLLSVAIRLALIGAVIGVAIHRPPVLAQGASATESAVRHYDIPAGPLSQVLTRFSVEAGIHLVGAGGEAEARTSPGLSGRHDLPSAFAALLAGTGLMAVEQQDGSYGLRPVPVPAPGSRSDRGGPTLPAVQVVGQAVRDATTEGTGSYTTRATTLGKTEHSLREIPQSVSVITRQQMDDRNVVTIEDAMHYATGIGYYTNAGQGSGSFYARGYGGLQAQYDGVANNTGGSNIQADMVIYDRIELQRGPAGLLQGAGNPAGTVNLVRKRGLGTRALEGSLTAGSWRNYGGHLDVTGPLDEAGRVRGRAVVAVRDRHFFYDHADERSLTGYLALDVDLGPRTTGGIAVLSQESHATPMAGVVAYTNGSMPRWKRSTNFNAPWGESMTRINEVSADVTHAFNTDWKAKAGVRYRQTRLDYHTGRLQSGLDPATGLLSRLRYEHQAQDETYYAADVNLSGVFQAFGRRHELLVGVNSEHNDYDYLWAVSPIDGSFDPANLPYDRSLLPRATPRTGYETNQAGVYAMTRLKLLEPLTLLLGGRLSDYQGRSRSIEAGTSRAWTTDTREKGEFTPYAGLVWDVSRQLSWYGSYADVFVPQSVKDWEGTTLKPRVGWQVETGIKGEFFNGALNTTLAFFRLRDENRPILDPDPSHTCNGGSCSIAGGLIQNQGWEIDISGSPLPGLELIAGYTRNETTPLKDSNPARQGVVQPPNTYLPRHALKFWGNYRFVDGALTGWNLGAGLQAYSRTEGSSGLRQGGYGVVSLQGGYQINQHWRAMVTVTNLFDRVYFRQLNAPAGYNYYGEPRQAMLTLRATY